MAKEVPGRLGPPLPLAPLLCLEVQPLVRRCGRETGSEGPGRLGAGFFLPKRSINGARYETDVLGRQESTRKPPSTPMCFFTRCRSGKKTSLAAGCRAIPGPQRAIDWFRLAGVGREKRRAQSPGIRPSVRILFGRMGKTQGRSSFGNSSTVPYQKGANS